MRRTTEKMKSKITRNDIISMCVGIVYLWLGILKFFPDLSPAENLAKNTIHILTFGLISSHMSIILIAILETAIGGMLIFNLYKRYAIMLALGHLACTFTPLIFFPEDTYNGTPLQLTLLGQYIAKNIVIAGALITVLNRTKKTA